MYIHVYIFFISLPIFLYVYIWMCGYMLFFSKTNFCIMCHSPLVSSQNSIRGINFGPEGHNFYFIIKNFRDWILILLYSIGILWSISSNFVNIFWSPSFFLHLTGGHTFFSSTQMKYTKIKDVYKKQQHGWILLVSKRMFNMLLNSY